LVLGVTGATAAPVKPLRISHILIGTSNYIGISILGGGQDDPFNLRTFSLYPHHLRRTGVCPLTTRTAISHSQTTSAAKACSPSTA